MYHGLLNVASASLTTLFQARLQKIPYVPIQTLSTCISPQNAANRHGRSSQPCLVVPLHVVRVTRVARPVMSSMVTRVTRVTRLRTRARGRARVRAARTARARPPRAARARPCARDSSDSCPSKTWTLTPLHTLSSILYDYHMFLWASITLL